MKTYNLIVKSENFISHYEIKANDLKEASIKAKAKFAKDFREFNTTVGIDPTDISNHINEIFEKFINAK